MIIYCVCCGKQAVNYHVSEKDPHCTIIEGGRAGFKLELIQVETLIKQFKRYESC